MKERLLPRAEVELRTGLAKSTIYKRIAAGSFPPPRREPGTHMVRWLESEIDQWIESWISVSRVGKVVGTEPMDNKKAA